MTLSFFLWAELPDRGIKQYELCLRVEKYIIVFHIGWINYCMANYLNLFFVKCGYNFSSLISCREPLNTEGAKKNVYTLTFLMYIFFWHPRYSPSISDRLLVSPSNLQTNIKKSSLNHWILFWYSEDLSNISLLLYKQTSCLFFGGSSHLLPTQADYWVYWTTTRGHDSHIFQLAFQKAILQTC